MKAYEGFKQDFDKEFKYGYGKFGIVSPYFVLMNKIDDIDGHKLRSKKYGRINRAFNGGTQ